jgi:hypothetical protein
MNGGRKSKPGNSSLKKIYHLFGRICLQLSAHATRVNRPTTDCLPMTEYFGRFFQFFSILSDLKCYRSAFSSSTNHFRNAKPKDQPTKISKENTFFRITKCVPIHFSSFWSLLLSNFIIFLFFIHWKRFKVLYKCHLKLHKSSWTIITIEQHMTNFLGVWELAYIMFSDLFFQSLTHSTLGIVTF